LADPGIGTFGYRIHIQLKSGTEIFTVRNACITSHSTTFNADGTSEETMEFMSYLDPLISTASDVTPTTTDF
jgi:hypothetical protein